ncbi:Beta-amylase [Bertholletia excelsa]
MAIAQPSAFSASFCCNRAKSNRSVRFSALRSRWSAAPSSRLGSITARLNSSALSNGSVSPDNGNLPPDTDSGDPEYELQHGVSPPRHRWKGSPVYVTLPADSVSASGEMRRRKIMATSFRALALAGVEGVVMEVWWGIVEREDPGVYNWRGYEEIVSLARWCGLKVRAIMAFHQCGTGPEDRTWIPLPQWVLEEIDKDPDIAYSDRFGRRNKEYISLGCDVLPILRGRSPIQAYADFMRKFRDTFRPLLGNIITGIQVGMGPAGELRYPSCPSDKLRWSWPFAEIGEFQCYDKYMLASLNAYAGEVGMMEGPLGAWSLEEDPRDSEFFKTLGKWNTLYDKFFLEWYSGMLLLHGERICMEAETIFRGTEVKISGKVAATYWHFETPSHASELTAGYYNAWNHDGYLPIIRMFGRYGFTLCCPCFEMKDEDDRELKPFSSPESFLKQLLLKARICGVPVDGENYSSGLDDGSFQQVLKMFKFYSSGLITPSFSFNFARMDKDLFKQNNWMNFIRFVRQLTNSNNFRAKLDICGVDGSQSSKSAVDAYAVLAY